MFAIIQGGNKSGKGVAIYLVLSQLEGIAER